MMHLNRLKHQIFKAISSGYFGMSQTNIVKPQKNINLSTFGQLGKEKSDGSGSLEDKFDTINKTLARIESKIDQKDRMTLFDSLKKLDAEISNLQQTGSLNSQRQMDQPSPNEVDQII